MALLYEGLTGFVESIFGRFHYSGPFVVLFLCGIGLPIPEEVTLIGSGLLVYEGHVDYVTISVVCSLAILAGDSVPYWLGRRYGDSILRLGWVRRIMRPGRVRLLRQRMSDHGNWVIFTCRFMPGIRIPGYFTAGLLKMTYLRFLILDGLGVLISVPTSIWVGQLFASQIDRLKDEMHNLHLLLALIILALVLTMLVRGRIRARVRQERRAAALAGLVDSREKPGDSGLRQEGGISEASPAPGGLHPGEPSEANSAEEQRTRD